MESELNKTPVKTDFDYDSESPVGTFSDMLDKSDSPCYVKWDFIVPAFSDKVKNAAMKLKSDVRKERLKHIRNLKRCRNNTTPIKDKNDSPLSKKSDTSIIQLHKTLNELLCDSKNTAVVLNPCEDSTSDFINDDHDNSNKENHNDIADCMNDDLFNDSVNELFAECSQTVEDKFYNQPKKKLFQSELSKNEEAVKTDLYGQVDHLICEKDDDLFLKVDLNNLDCNL